MNSGKRWTRRRLDARRVDAGGCDGHRGVLEDELVFGKDDNQGTVVVVAAVDYRH